MGFFSKLAESLKKTKDKIADTFARVFSIDRIGEEFYDELTDALIASDISVNTAMDTVDALRDEMIEGSVKDKNEVVKKLKEISKPVSSNNEIAQIASISAGDEEIGRLIAEGFEKVGKDGVLTVEDSKTLKTELKIVEGLQFDRGYLSPYMVNNTDKMECILNDCYILITDKKIKSSNKFDF